MNSKLYQKFYGPFSVLHRIGQVAYQLNLHANTKIPLVLHISLLKPFYGSSTVNDSSYLLIDSSDIQIPNIPLAILNSRTINDIGQLKTQVLVQ